ncbi:M15 family metallopeptidase [Laspinema olomoucense]|uniref:D-alanyl-D-alanine carboxypeptidase family protein n=1 Tax=Laspinema olomoucense D3b TaxID=2953688 RepID=A0ABT2N924_9CYAN|nr:MULTISPECIES: M15 family metallopeptidase [unclassified Laspinema]MCT7975907.1 D-alanyl-D-alanine carboxypeptidase family protein [Laspinema sp. D3d]MCT7979182.1 D-alanyl-D-alanine carboxypeptidase family protein [Laspinema sp. D3b]MCT7991302.1 D-alanyl-D-alanine carboxypeptidase family protein [Laspinema sp. D3a]MCT7997111.1 D-alanyl-D-alanine carboxypeptidase family protein [Laspinema sp. D3c]
MNKATVSGQASKTSTFMGEDIPQAVRDTSEKVSTVQGSKSVKWIVIALIAGTVALVAGVLVAWQGGMLGLLNNSQVAQTEQTDSPDPNATVDPTAPKTETLLGHFPYKEAPREDLQPISSDGRILMRQAAARAFLEMKEAARSQGVSLVPISGFRSEEDQKYLFFEVKAQRGQVTTERAEVSAPPGYSEHHTGYAVDIGDANLPATDLSPSFENTPAFQWMKENAAYYSFEVSFPKGNTQGVTYEPWHWRFVGDRDSLETFYKARNPQKNIETQP